MVSLIITITIHKSLPLTQINQYHYKAWSPWIKGENPAGRCPVVNSMLIKPTDKNKTTTSTLIVYSLSWIQASIRWVLAIDHLSVNNHVRSSIGYEVLAWRKTQHFNNMFLSVSFNFLKCFFMVSEKLQGCQKRLGNTLHKHINENSHSYNLFIYLVWTYVQVFGISLKTRKKNIF